MGGGGVGEAPFLFFMHGGGLQVFFMHGGVLTISYFMHGQYF